MKAPPFSSAPAKMAHDFSTQAGAQVLADMIRAAWLRAGHDVRVEVAETQPGHPHTSYVVRMPSLLNGLPK